MNDAIRLVVSDVDGTLVDKQKQVTDSTAAAVGRLTDAGLGFTIISARPRSGMMPIADKLSIDAPMGAFNGGTVFKRDGTILCQHRVDPEVVRTMLELAEGVAADIWVFADDLWYASTDRGGHIGSERKASNQEPVITQDFARFVERTDKMTFVSDDPAVLQGLHARAAHLSDRATIMQSQTYYLDVTALPANKGDGIALLAEAMGTPLSAVAAIGDQANDLPMFARAGLSIAMGQGPAEVRAKADLVTGGNDDDGVAQAIDGMILGQI
ncbi:Cof-type HAD-IIB family hydrolase [Sphingomonas sp. PB4P5]|uniref:Cof-type HAD-IIB family hydrolase n=1 Tax=Parasphingomonas puruogangriensis TaxID=3096155 RepID=UPI002FC93C5A